MSKARPGETEEERSERVTAQDAAERDIPVPDGYEPTDEEMELYILDHTTEDGTLELNIF